MEYSIRINIQDVVSRGSIERLEKLGVNHAAIPRVRAAKLHRAMAYLYDHLTFDCDIEHDTDTIVIRTLAVNTPGVEKAASSLVATCRLLFS